MPAAMPAAMPDVSPLIDLDLANQSYRRDLGDGLILRWSTAEDLDELLRLYGMVFRQTADDSPNVVIQAWVRDMMSDRHPSISSQDFAVVEDSRHPDGLPHIVAATCLLSQIWQYDGITIPLGRPEVVATEIAYRQRGLIRAIFELIHARSAVHGDLALGITGIAYFYRQFGYEYALELPTERALSFEQIPVAKAEEPDAYGLRRAQLQDIPVLMRLYDQQCTTYTVSTRLAEAYWRWITDTEQGIGAISDSGALPYLIEERTDAATASPSRRVVGYVLTNQHRHAKGAFLGILALGVDPSVSLAQVLPATLRALRQDAPTIPANVEDPVAPVHLQFEMGNEHPVCRLLDRSLTAGAGVSYAWYVRVPNLPAFIRHIAPVLERRLADLAFSGHSGELALNFHRNGLRLVFDHGKLTIAEDWRKPVWEKEQAGFPPLVFLQLLFGYRSLLDLRRAFPDVQVDQDAQPLLDTLFPVRTSWALWLC